MTHFEQGHGRIVFWLIFFLLIIAAGIFVWPFLNAILVAGVLSVLLFPFYKRLTGRFSDTVASLIVTLGAVAVILLPLVTASIIGGAQAYQRVNVFISEQGDTAAAIESVTKDLDERLKPLLEKVGVTDFHLKGYWEENKESIQDSAKSPLTEGLKGFVIGVVTLVIALLTMFFMLRDGKSLIDPVCEVVPLPREETLAILQRMSNTIRAVFLGIVLVAIFQGLIAGILYWALGIPGAFLWMLLTMVICMIPLLGGPVIYFPMALWLFATGEPVKAFVLLGVGLGIISQIDNRS